MSSTQTYNSEVEVPKEWINKIEEMGESPYKKKMELSEQRNKFIKEYYGKHSARQIAKVLGVSVRTVEKKVSRLRDIGEL